MDNNKVKWGIRIFGIILGILCLSGAVWSIFAPGANKPLTPDEQRKMDDLKNQEDETMKSGATHAK